MILDIDTDDSIDLQPCISIVLIIGLLTAFYSIGMNEISPEL